MHTCSTHEQIFTTSLQSTEIIDGIDNLFHKFSRNYHVKKTIKVFYSISLSSVGFLF